MLALSETHLREDVQNEIPDISGYTSWNSERKGSDKGGGGLRLLYKSELPVHKHQPTVPEHLQYVKNERQWLLFANGCRKVAFLHCYLACQTTRDNSFLQWNEDLLFLLKQEAKLLKHQGFIVVALGDFNTRVGRLPGLSENTPDINQNFDLFMNFIQELGLIIVNTLPVCKGLFTWYNDNEHRPGTRSLLDYCLIDQDSVTHVSSFVIDEEVRFRVGGDHALLECILKFSGPQSKINLKYQDIIQYNITESTNYGGYSRELDSSISSIPLIKFQELPMSNMLAHITRSISECAHKTIGIKMIRKKRGRKLPQSIRNLIKQKNNLVREFVHDTKDQVGIKESKVLRIKVVDV